MRLRRTGWRALFAAALAFAVGGLGAATSATAAPPYETTASIDTIEFVQEEVTSGKRAELRGTWSLPDNPATPAGFVVDLPDELVGFSDEFALLTPDGAEMGRCTVTAEQLVCDFDDAYLAENPRDLAGTFYFWVEVTTEVTEPTEEVYDFGSVTGTVTVNPPSDDPCTEDCEWAGDEAWKYGFQRDGDTIRWTVSLPKPVDGYAEGLTLTVTDVLGPNQQLREERPYRVYESTTLGYNEDGVETPTGWEEVDADRITATDGGATLTWESVAGSWYEVLFYSTFTGGAAGDTYTNEASFVIEGESTTPVEAEVVRTGGGGTGLGQNVGRFVVTKEVVGDALVPEDAEYTLDYVVVTPDGERIEASGTVTAGGEFRSPEYPRGSTVTLSERLPADSLAVTWADPVFSSDSFELPGGVETPVVLTNEATLQTGTFAARKLLAGDAEVVPDDATFTLEYAYPAGDGYPAGAGELELTADGAVVESGELPLGAELALSEATPEPVEGATWGEATISPSTLTVGEDPEVVVEVTNTITDDTPPVKPGTDEPGTDEPGTDEPGTDEPGTDEPAAGLPVTGGHLAGAGLAALLLVVAGGVLLTARRSAAVQ